MRSSLWGLIRFNGSHLFWELKLVNMHLPWRRSNLIRVWTAHSHPQERKKNTHKWYLFKISNALLPMGLHQEQLESSCFSDCSPEKKMMCCPHKSQTSQCNLKNSPWNSPKWSFEFCYSYYLCSSNFKTLLFCVSLHFGLGNFTQYKFIYFIYLFIFFLTALSL